MRRVSNRPIGVAAVAATTVTTHQSRRTAATGHVPDPKVSDLPKFKEQNFNAIHKPDPHENTNQPVGLGPHGFVYGAKICDMRDHAFVACDLPKAGTPRPAGPALAASGRQLRRMDATSWKGLYSKQPYIRNGAEFYRDGASTVPSQRALNAMTAQTLFRSYNRTPTRWWVQRHADGGEPFANHQEVSRSTWSEFVYSVLIPPTVVALVMWLYSHDLFALYADWSTAEGQINPELFRRRAANERGYQTQIADANDAAKVARNKPLVVRATADGKNFYTPLWSELNPNWMHQGLYVPNGAHGFRSIFFGPGRRSAADREAIARRRRRVDDRGSNIEFEREADMLREN